MTSRFVIFMNAQNAVENIVRCYFNLIPNMHLRMKVGEANIILAALLPKDCVSITGIKDRTLFKENARQSPAVDNEVNEKLKKMINGNDRLNFFFHNSITAICTNMRINGNTLESDELSIVNSCQSLVPIYYSKEIMKTLENTYVLCGFYEIP